VGQQVRAAMRRSVVRAFRSDVPPLPVVQSQRYAKDRRRQVIRLGHHERSSGETCGRGHPNPDKSDSQVLHRLGNRDALQTRAVRRTSFGIPAVLQNVSTSTTACAKACGASCGMLWPTPPVMSR